MTREIKQITVGEFFNNPSSESLLKGYANECSIAGMPQPNPDRKMYNLLETSGKFKIFGSFNFGVLDGFMVFLLNQNPHYSVPIGTIESIFVAKGCRSGGAGLALINKAKELGKEGGAAGLFISAPASGAFTKVMEGLGAKHTNNVFFWSI